MIPPQTIWALGRSTAQLRSLRFSPFKKLVVSGSDDDIVHPRNSHWLARHLGSELVIIEGYAW